MTLPDQGKRVEYRVWWANGHNAPTTDLAGYLTWSKTLGHEVVSVERREVTDWVPVALDEGRLCPTCGGRGWHTAGGNDPMPCGRCSAGEAWSSGTFDDEERCRHDGEIVTQRGAGSYCGHCGVPVASREPERSDA
jgi:hypothetical protein